jgi:hypothetical protein
MSGNEASELLHDRVVPAECEISLDPLLERSKMQLLEAADLLLGKGLVCEVGEWRATPESEGFPERLGSFVGFVRGE